MWLANLLTVARIPLAALFAVVADRPRWALAVLAVAGLTDAVDGRIARRARARGATGRGSEIGPWLDPMCDKVFAVTVLTAVAIEIRPPLILLVLIGARELIVVPLVLAYRLTRLHRIRVDFHAAPAGKAATIAQFAAIAAIVAKLPQAPAFAVLAAGIGLVAAGQYVRRAARARREQATPEGRSAASSTYPQVSTHHEHRTRPAS